MKQFGLKSIISKQILRKYAINRNAKKINIMKLIVPAQEIKFSHEERKIMISSLNLTLNFHFRNDFLKINQVEIDKEYAYILVTIPEET